MQPARTALRFIPGLVLISSAGCMPPPMVDCGPLSVVECEHRVAEIQGVVADGFPGRRIEAIRILNADGQATVILDDGTEVGYGERL